LSGIPAIPNSFIFVCRVQAIQKIQVTFKMNESEELLTIKEASRWASERLSKNVTTANITYLLQYGRIKKLEQDGSTRISKAELFNYYSDYLEDRPFAWKDKLGKDLNWTLSFDKYKEAQTTKHVHRLHPYKGKFIPQLVEYFLDGHIDQFKTTTFINKGDIVLDPFCGSGTSLVQAAELGIHAIGVDISTFNTLISNAKVSHYDFKALSDQIDRITKFLQIHWQNSPIRSFEKNLQKALIQFNYEHFPSPAYKYQLKQGQIDESSYGKEKEDRFLVVFNELTRRFRVQHQKKKTDRFLDRWYAESIGDEIQLVAEEINKIQDPVNKNMISLLLSRTIRSCRATSHSDLATLIEPIRTTYYCTKHGKICKPLFSIFKWWKTYSKDTVKRLADFKTLRTNTHQICLNGDSRTIDIIEALKKINPALAAMLKHQRIKAVFSSPPYVGLIDYHEQHAYAYDLFGFGRQDALEIGPLFKGQGIEARKNYILGISEVLQNCKQFLCDDYNIFLVANDKYKLYPSIVEKSGMKIVNQYKRPVLNRTEKEKGAYSEVIFHIKND
jgi:DNA modification methylase